jgi:uncharacterized Zn finger protein
MARRRRRSYSYYYDSRFPPRSVPRDVKGGIKSQSKRGAFGESWWARRWIGVLEGFDIGARLNRGRSYARKGQVLSIQIEQGMVKAQVQGSRPKPYQTAIQVEKLSSGDWKKVAHVLSTQAIFTAKLLAGEMPDNIEEAFVGAGVSLFPERLRDLKTDCSCPDWSNPCKHIAAVYYLLGEEFDRDPFLIFRLRGMNRKDLVKLIGGQANVSAKQTKKKGAPPLAEEDRTAAVEPLPTDPELFWEHMQVEGAGFWEVSIPQVCAALPKRLGKFPFWSGEEDFIQALEGIYLPASQRGLEVFLGEPVFLPESEGTAL